MTEPLHQHKTLISNANEGKNNHDTASLAVKPHSPLLAPTQAHQLAAPRYICITW